MSDQIKSQTMRKSFELQGNNDLAEQVCRALGLDPNHVLELNLSFVPGDHGQNILEVEVVLVGVSEITDKLCEVDWSVVAVSAEEGMNNIRAMTADDDDEGVGE